MTNEQKKATKEYPYSYPPVTIDSLFSDVMEPMYILVDGIPVKVYKYIGTERNPSILKTNSPTIKISKEIGINLPSLLGDVHLSLARDDEGNWYTYNIDHIYTSQEEAMEAARKQKRVNAKAEYARYNAAQYPNRQRVPSSQIVNRIHNGGRRTRKHKHKRKIKRTFKKARK